jgi:hypothetical protein
MKDTPAHVEKRYRDMMMARTPVERLKMASRMFSTAKALVRAGLLHQYGHLEPQELRRHIFLRFYGNDFSEAEREKILEYLTAPQPPRPPDAPAPDSERHRGDR